MKKLKTTNKSITRQSVLDDLSLITNKDKNIDYIIAECYATLSHYDKNFNEDCIECYTKALLKLYNSDEMFEMLMDILILGGCPNKSCNFISLFRNYISTNLMNKKKKIIEN